MATVDFRNIKTPFYYYNMELLGSTLATLQESLSDFPYHIHYAIKANANPRILERIAQAGHGADCVSGGEIKRAIECGFNPKTIVFAGVGKTDDEIEYALSVGIFSFNCESVAEIEVINEIAAKNNQIADIAIRLNPEVKADTHRHITTGTKENKFGIALCDLDKTISTIQSCKNINWIGLHFHIGSQILEMDNFRNLANKTIEIQQDLLNRGIQLQHINFGGGLGINYQSPHETGIANFQDYFKTFQQNYQSPYPVTIHFELGRSIVAHCGDLISKVLYVKEGVAKNFVIIDAGMNDLMRPALYQAHHHIENISSDKSPATYDVVGPVCESTDCFAKNIELPQTQRGDIIVIHSCGAYGETMASEYNLRPLIRPYYSDELND